MPFFKSIESNFHHTQKQKNLDNQRTSKVLCLIDFVKLSGWQEVNPTRNMFKNQYVTQNKFPKVTE